MRGRRAVGFGVWTRHFGGAQGARAEPLGAGTAGERTEALDSRALDADIPGPLGPGLLAAGSWIMNTRVPRSNGDEPS